MPTERPLVFVPEPLPAAAIALLTPVAEVRQGVSGRRYGEDELIAEMAAADAVIITSREKVTRRVIEGVPKLRMITKSGAPPTNVDAAAARDRGVLVTWTPGANAASVAEFTMALLLAASHRLLEFRESLLRGEWRNFGMLGVELDGKVLGLVGCGQPAGHLMMPEFSSPEWSSVGGKFRRRFPQLSRGPENQGRSALPESRSICA